MTQYQPNPPAKEQSIEKRVARLETQGDLLREHVRSVVRELLTPFPSGLTGDQARERLREINVRLYRALETI